MNASSDTGTRKARTQSVGRAVSGLAKRALDKRGFVDASIVNEWPTIAGALIGGNSLPEKISFPRDRSKPGTLHLRLENGALSTEVMHFEPVLLERLNRFFGFRAVGHIKIIQGPLPNEEKKARPGLPPLQAETRAAIEESLDTVTDSEVRDALIQLGKHVAQRRSVD